MNNSEMPATPCEFNFDTNTGTTHEMFSGLTKREHFAGLAMQSLILAIPAWEALGYPCPSHWDTAFEAYKYADLMCEHPIDGISK